MRKWELKYNELKGGKLEQDIEQLKQKVEAKSATKEEYKEYTKLLKVQANMPKIANIIEYKEKLSEEISKVEKELETLKKSESFNENSEKAEKTIKAIDIKMNKISEEKLDIQKQLKNPKLNKEEKEKLLNRSKELDKEMEDNNEKYVKLQKWLEAKDKTEKQIPSASKEELENRKNELFQKRSKCNLVGKNLVAGLSWDSIEMNLDKWKDRTLTAKKEVAKNSEMTKEESEKTYNDEQEETYTGEYEEENLPAKVSIFAKIKNKISSLVKKVFKSRKKEEIEEVEEVEEKDNNEVTKPEESEKTERDDFTKYLREVAEKGYKEVNKEEAMKKLEELKKEAYKRETEKYGEEYAKRSMKQEENER